MQFDWQTPLWHFEATDFDPNCQYDVRGDYVEEFWLPLLGPSCIAVLRKFAEPLRQNGRLVFAADLVPHLVGMRGCGRSSVFGRTIRRLVYHNHAEIKDASTVALRTYLPALRSTQVDQLHPAIAERHREFMEEAI